RQMLANPLIDSLITAAKKRQRFDLGELRGNPVVELASRRSQDRNVPVSVGVGSVNGLQCRVDHVHPDDHACATSVGSVVNLTARERGRIAIVEEPQLVALPEGIAHMPLAEEPAEPFRKEREDVDRQSTISTRIRFPSLTPPAFMTLRNAFAVRPCRPITLPRSDSATASSRT